MTILGIITIITGITFLLNAMYSMSDSCSGKKIVQNKLLFWLLITSEKHTGPLIILHQLTFSSHYINSKQGNENIKYNLN